MKKNTNLDLKRTLPHLDYYTLQQATSELRAFFGREDIDENYLIQLGAAGKIILSTSTFGKNTLVEYNIGFDEQENLVNKALAYLLSNEYGYYLFYNLEPRDLTALNLPNKPEKMFFYGYWIYDLFGTFGKLEKNGALEGFYSDNEIDSDMQGKITQQVLKKLSDARDGLVYPANELSCPFIGAFIKPSDLRFGFAKDYTLPSGVVPSYNDNTEKCGSEFFDGFTIDKDDLCIVFPELQRIFDSNFRTLTAENLVVPQPVREMKKPEEEASNLVIIGAMLESFRKITEALKSKTSGSQSNIINTILEQYSDIHGISETTLKYRFSSANKIIQEKIKTRTDLKINKNNEK